MKHANDDDNDDDDNNNDDQNFAERDRSYLETLEELFPEIPREYLNKFWNRSGDIDFIYGFNHDMDTGTWTIGTKVADFLANGDIKIGDIRMRALTYCFSTVRLDIMQKMKNNTRKFWNKHNNKTYFT